MPLFTLAQQTEDAHQAVLDAKKDADISDDPFSYGCFVFVATLGCLNGLAALAAVHRDLPTPPAERFIGKSPEYIKFYTQTYQQTIVRQRRGATVCGCLAGNLVTAAITGVFWKWYFQNH